MVFKSIVGFFAACMSFLACNPKTNTTAVANPNSNTTTTNETTSNNMDGLQKATFGAGCFWCVEAVFQDLNGVTKVESGYAGGQVENPTYKQVCEGTTGHAEVIQLTYDPQKISYKELLEVFWKTHDPTTLNRQGNDVGTQYRSAIFYHNEEQKQLAEAMKKEAQAWFDQPIVTEIVAYSNYYAAENYHQDYFNLNGDKNPYCSAVINPKVIKFRKEFKSKLKEGIKP